MKAKKTSLYLLDNFIWVLLIILINFASGIENSLTVRNFSNVLYNSAAIGDARHGILPDCRTD